MQILWVSGRAPLSTIPTAGSKTYFFYFNYLKKIHNITVVCTEELSRKNQIAEELGENCFPIFWGEKTLRKIYNIESKVNPYTKYAGVIQNCDSVRVLSVAKKLANKGYVPDVIILEWTSMVMLSNDIHTLFPKAKIIASEHDVTFVGYERKKEYYANKFLKSIYWKAKSYNEKNKELQALSLCDAILVQNPENAELLFNNGIRKEKIHLLSPFFQDLTHLKRKPNGKDILFYGAMSRKENYLSAIWFIENVMPLLRDLEVRFIVLGSKPNAQLKKFNNERIVITGFVENVEPYFSESLCFVAPLVLGAGIKVKTIEAFSSGIPVLTNEIGIEGIPADHSKDYYYCTNANDYSNIIRKLYFSKCTDDRGTNGKKMFLKNYSLEKSCENYKNLIFHIMEG